MKLAKNGSAVDWSADYFEESKTCEVNGIALGSGGDRYSTAVALDLWNQMVLDYTCTCPAHAYYRGMCKHAVALALTFRENQDTTDRSMQRPIPAAGLPGCPSRGRCASPRRW